MRRARKEARFDQHDPYYRLAKVEKYRARSAYKLIEILENNELINEETKFVLDLCAAPGSWSQVLANVLRGRSVIVAVDLQVMASIHGVTNLVGDITTRETAQEIEKNFHGNKCDLVVCDGAPDVTGVGAYDEVAQEELLRNSLRLCMRLLKQGGNFVAKSFRHENAVETVAWFESYFSEVALKKPAASRSSSNEAFLVCRDFRNPEEWE